MQTLTHDELKALTDWEQGPSISIYLPRHQAVSELGKDAIVLRNMLDEAETRLQNQGFGSPGNFWNRHETYRMMIPSGNWALPRGCVYCWHRVPFTSLICLTSVHKCSQSMTHFISAPYFIKCMKTTGLMCWPSAQKRCG